eukprot:8347169-Alexandrium_andersonii.AAC.1
MSPRNCCAPPPDPWPPEHLDRAGPPGSPSAGASKSAPFEISASSISTLAAGPIPSAASAASLCSSSSAGR